MEQQTNGTTTFAAPLAAMDGGGPSAPSTTAVTAPPGGSSNGNGVAAMLTVVAVCWYLYTRHYELVMELYARVKALLGLGAAPPTAAGSSPQEAVDEKSASSGVEPAEVVRKLRALNARLYGVQSCGWTVRQLEEFGAAKAAATREVYVDCAEASPSASCAKITHFPTWEIGGKQMPPGMVALDVLNTQCDSMLVATVEAMNADKAQGKKDVATTAAAAEKKTEEAATDAGGDEDDDEPAVLATPPPSSPQKPAATTTTDEDEEAEPPADAEATPEPEIEASPEEAPEPVVVEEEESPAKKPRRRRKRG